MAGDRLYRKNNNSVWYGWYYGQEDKPVYVCTKQQDRAAARAALRQLEREALGAPGTKRAIGDSGHLVRDAAPALPRCRLPRRRRPRRRAVRASGSQCDGAGRGNGTSSRRSVCKHLATDDLARRLLATPQASHALTATFGVLDDADAHIALAHPSDAYSMT